MSKLVGLSKLIVLALSGFALPAWADTVCLLKQPEAETRARIKGEPRLGVVTSVEGAASYQTKGFTVVPCPSIDSQALYRDSICAAAERGNSSLQAQLERALGEKPAKICASTRAVVTLQTRINVKDLQISPGGVRPPPAGEASPGAGTSPQPAQPQN